jgi:hypothetical protein
MGFAVVVQEAAPSRGRGLGGRGRYLPTVAWLTSTPSLSNSPWMRGAPELIWRGAAKYGALFNESGWVEIFWTIA